MHIESCFVPELYDNYHNKDAVVVVVDILRATCSICTAFKNGVRTIIPVASIEEAKEMKEKGFLVAAEKDGIKRDFADFGNSPYNFSPENVKDKDIVYATTNGTRTIHKAAAAHQIAIGAFTNIQAIADWCERNKRDVIILCAGWKGKFNIEDTLFAGALAEILLNGNNFETICDATNAAMDLWSVAKKDLQTYIQKTAQHCRLNKNGLGECITYCFTPNVYNQVPVFDKETGQLVLA